MASSTAGLMRIWTGAGAAPSSRFSAPDAIASRWPSAENASALTGEGSTYCRMRFFATGSHSAQWLSPPPVAKVP